MHDNPLSESYIAPKEQYSPLYDAIEQLAQKAGIAVPEVRLLHPESLLHKFPAAAILNNTQHAVLFSERNCQHLFDVNFTNGGHITDEFRAVIAHEFGHLARNDIATLQRTKYTPLAMALGAMVGLYAYRSYREKHPNTKETNHDAVRDEVTKQMPPVDHKTSPTLHAIGIVGLYFATALAGLVTGVMAIRQLRHHMEYACDAYSKKLMGSGEPLARAFEMIQGHHNEFMEQIKSLPEAQRTELLAKVKLLEVEQFFLHPPTEKRIAALRS